MSIGFAADSFLCCHSLLRLFVSCRRLRGVVDCTDESYEGMIIVSIISDHNLRRSKILQIGINQTLPCVSIGREVIFPKTNERSKAQGMV